MFSVMVNGTLESYFSGRKGLRLGDPLSSFLFNMVMEVLSRLLNQSSEDFCYHICWDKVRLNHLSFANDLMFFCAAERVLCSLLGIP